MTSVQFQIRNRHTYLVPNFCGALLHRDGSLGNVGDRHHYGELRHEIIPASAGAIYAHVPPPGAFALDVRDKKFWYAEEPRIPTHSAFAPAKRLEANTDATRAGCKLIRSVPAQVRANISHAVAPCSNSEHLPIFPARLMRSFPNGAAA